MQNKKFLVLSLLPMIIWLAVFLVLPYFFILIQSFLSTDVFGKVIYTFNFDSYIKILTTPLYFNTLVRTLWFAFIVMTSCIILSLPLAYYIAFHVKKNKSIFYSLMVLPFWVSYIVRAYTWKIILGQEGILNNMLQYLGFIDEPIQLFLYSDFSAIVCLIYILVPFVIIPIYASFEHIPKNVLEASRDLGASSVVTFKKIILPLAIPGIISGGTFAFVLTLGDFLASFLLGGPRTLMISNVLSNLFGTSNDKPLGSALGVILLLLVVGILEISTRFEKKYSLKQKLH